MDAMESNSTSPYNPLRYLSELKTELDDLQSAYSKSVIDMMHSNKLSNAVKDRDHYQQKVNHYEQKIELLNKMIKEENSTSAAALNKAVVNSTVAVVANKTNATAAK